MCLYLILDFSQVINLPLKYICPHIFLVHKFHLFCGHPSSGDLMERKLEVHKSLTLGEVTERAYQVSEYVC